MVIVGHLFSFLMGKCQNESHLPLCRAIDFPTASFLHAGEVSNGSGRRAHGDIFPAGTVETTMTAGNRDKKCTPARRATARASGHTVAYSTPQAAKRPCRRGNGMKNARR